MCKKCQQISCSGCTSPEVRLANCEEQVEPVPTCNCKFFDLLDVVRGCSSWIHWYIPYVTPDCRIDFALPSALFNYKDHKVWVSPDDPNPSTLENKLSVCVNNPLTLSWSLTWANRRWILCRDASKFQQKIIDHTDWLEVDNWEYWCPKWMVTSNGINWFYVQCPKKLYWWEIELANTYNTVQLPEDVNAYLTIPDTERTHTDNWSLRFSQAAVTPWGLWPFVVQTRWRKAEQDTYIEVNFQWNVKNGSWVRTTRAWVAILDSNNNKKRIIFSDRFESWAFDPDITTSHEDFTNTAKYANLARAVSWTGYWAWRIIPIQKDDIIIPIYKISTFVNNTLEPNESVRQIRIEWAWDDFDWSFVQINERSEYSYYIN